MRRTPLTIKGVLLFNARDKSYTVVAHNCGPKIAAELVAAYRRDGLPAFEFDQNGAIHDSGDAETCTACRRLIQRKGGPK